MPIVLRETSNSTPAPEGTHPAICYRIVDVGIQPDSGFGERHKLVISWELTSEMMPPGPDGTRKPFGVSKTYTFSLNAKATLRQDLVRWRGREFSKEEVKGFKLSAILGKPCQVAVIHNDSGNAKVDGVFAIPKGMPMPKPFNPLVEYSLEQGKDKVYESLPNWLKQMVDAGLRKAAEQQAAPPPEEEPLPEEPLEDGNPAPF